MPPHKGYQQTTEHKARLSNSLRQYYIDHPEARVEKGKEKTQYYTNHPEERSKIAERMRQFWARLSTGERCERCRKGCEVATSLLKGKPQPQRVIDRRVQGMIGHPVSEVARRKMSQARKRWILENPEKARILFSKKPTKPELRAFELIEKACPNEYKYTGDGTLIINYLNPDFANVNGKKKVIEVFGDYWHGEGAKKWHQTELGRIMAYNSMGFDCLILWASELKNKPETEIIAMIQEFNRKPLHCRKTA